MGQERIARDDAVEVVGIALGLHQRLATARRAALEVRISDGRAAVESPRDLLRGHGDVVHGEVEVVGDRALYGHVRRRERPREVAPRCPVSVLATAKPRAMAAVLGPLTLPTKPPPLVIRNRPFQPAGRSSPKPSRFGFPDGDATEPTTRQYSWTLAVAATSAADVMVTPGTPSAASAATVHPGSAACAGAAASETPMMPAASLPIAAWARRRRRACSWGDPMCHTIELSFCAREVAVASILMPGRDQADREPQGEGDQPAGFAAPPRLARLDKLRVRGNSLARTAPRTHRRGGRPTHCTLSCTARQESSHAPRHQG